MGFLVLFLLGVGDVHHHKIGWDCDRNLIFGAEIEKHLFSNGIKC